MRFAAIADQGQRVVARAFTNYEGYTASSCISAGDIGLKIVGKQTPAAEG